MTWVLPASNSGTGVARTAVVAGTDVKNAANLSSARPVLTEEQWSNLFGKNMLEAPTR